METLCHNDLLELNRAVGELYSARDRETYYRSVFETVQRLIPSDIRGFNEIGFHPTRFLNSIAGSQEHGNVTSRYFPALNAFIHEHPLIPHAFSDTVLKTTDYISKRKFKATALYSEFYKHQDVETQISLSFPLSHDRVLAFTLSKKGPDFSERDRLLLTLLKPHMKSALRNAIEHGRMRLERDLLQKSAEAERQGAVLFQSDGTILCISPFAKELLARYFDAASAEGDTLPEKLMEWFRAETNPSPLSATMGGSRGFPKRVVRESLTLEKDERCVKITLLNDFTTGDYVLVISETDTSLLLRKLQGCGLSFREAVVLTWLSKGKTNLEIAIILDMSRRTVEKHLEHIFTKLGVETRAAAAAIVRTP